jgi:hypothetical protein
MKDLKEEIESKIKKKRIIAYFDTVSNQKVWDTFLLFCENEADNNYLQGIKVLLESYSTDWKYASLYNDIESIKKDLFDLKEKKNEKDKEDRSVVTFGRK